MKNETNMTKQNKYLLYLMAAGLSILLILRDINGISVNKFIYFGYAVAFMAVANYQTLVQMICFILPLVCGLPGTYIMPCAFLLLLIKRGDFKLVQIIPVMGILLMELFAAFWYPSTGFAAIIHYVFFAAVMIFLIQEDKLVDYDKCIVLYLLGTVILCYVILNAAFANAPRNWLTLFAEGQFRIGDSHVGTSQMTLKLNANSMAYYSLVGIACSLLLAEKRSGVKKVWYIMLVVFFAIVGFLTLSRSWLLVTGICFLLYVISKLRRPRHFIPLLLVIVAIGALVSLIFNKNPELLAGFNSRFDGETVEGAGGRIKIFENYMRAYFSDIRFVLFGTGVTQYSTVAGMAGSIHNGTQQILVCCGIVGFVLYMVVLITPVLRVRCGRKLSMVYWLPLISIVMFVQTIQFLNPMMLMLPYVVGVYALRVGEQKNEIIFDNR